MRTERALLLTIVLTTGALMAGGVLIRSSDHARELAALRARVAKLETDAAQAQRSKLAAFAWPDAPLVMPGR